jgi:3-oxoacyl-[acyl-carrier-protein] synthase-1
MNYPVVVSAVGIINALGSSVSEVRERLFAGDQSRLTKTTDFTPERACFVAPVHTTLPECPAGLEPLWSRNAALSLAAFQQIAAATAEAIERYGPTRVGVVVGSSTSGIAAGEVAVSQRLSAGTLPHDYRYAQQQMGTVAQIIATLAGAAGPHYTISTACSSSAKVFRAAGRLLDAGICDCVITGGIDSLCNLTVRGFSALELVSEEVTNPFSKNRKGITIGEGGALFLLERAHRDTPLDTLVAVRGVGESSDAYHISTPDPRATGAIAAIEAALKRAALTPAEIDYVNLHGTGTPHNDSMEAVAMHHIFPCATPCSSTKPLVGHMLGASGATEVAFCWMTLTDPTNRLPPHRFDGVQDETLPQLHLTARGDQLPRPARVCLSNSFGFGGSNCAVILSRVG